MGNVVVHGVLASKQGFGFSPEDTLKALKVGKNQGKALETGKEKECDSALGYGERSSCKQATQKRIKKSRLHYQQKVGVDKTEAKPTGGRKKMAGGRKERTNEARKNPHHQQKENEPSSCRRKP